ncbi:hypothetical protein L914_19779 [Phytophthora nicotianae]|uniref:Uncharacterized protein n=1 Tax=Phytophthora nicotianae TaxID=4792 RepID=W2M9D8_PHYNI|nr:hypothetical protein L914_19779 [Phytophthora nicotianae]
MLVASKYREHDKLPANAIHNRWSTVSALDIKDELVIAAASLQNVVSMSKLRLPKRLPNETDETEASASTKGVNEVVYVRLRRNERANKIVLSSAEKYCYAKAMLEPLLEHLSGLSSANFYDELCAWKETVEVGLRRFSKASGGHDVDTDGRTDGENASDTGVLSMLDPADAIGTAKLMEEMEMANVDSVTEASSDSDVPQTQPAAVSVVSTPAAATKSEAEESLQQERVLPISLEATATIPTSRGREGEDEADRKPARQVDIISMPKPKRRINSRAITKQLRQTTLVPERLALHKYPSKLSVTLEELVAWARNTPNMKFVLETMNKYPVLLEDAYLRTHTIAAITTAKREQCKPDELDESVKKHGIVLDMVASIDPQIWKFSGAYIGSLVGFHAIKTKGHMWFEDRKWLEQNWLKIPSNVSLFARETRTQGLSADAVCNRHKALANEVIAKFASSRLLTEFMALSGNRTITFENILGGLCRGGSMTATSISACVRLGV